MTPLEATVTIMGQLLMTGKLHELNTGQVFDLTEQYMELFSARKRGPKAKPDAAPVAKPSGPVHVDMGGDQW